MSYDKAKQYFEEIRKDLQYPANEREEIIWKISLGLSELTEALESDLSDLRRLLNRLSEGRAP